MAVMKKSFVTNLKIAITYKPIEIIYLLNHQDCGAIGGILYHAVVIQLKMKPISKRKFVSMLNVTSKKIQKNILVLIDATGTVANCNSKNKRWTIV